MAQPKYQLLQQWLRDQINSREYTANQQIPTELELAEQFGYSRQTIRQAISGLEQEGLLKRTPGRGTFVCQQNAGRVNRSESRTRRVGVLTTYLDDYIFPGIINGIERVLSRHDYLFTLGLTHNKTLDEATALQKLLADVDLEALSAQLHAELKDASGQKKARIVKRLEVVDAFRISGNKPEWMIMDVLPILPPDLRPMVQLDGGRFATSDLNDLYRRVINRNNRLKRLMDLNAPDIIVRNEKRMLQEAVDALIDNGRRGRAVTGANNRALKSLSDFLKGKQGRFRQNLLGKRVDYSGRSVIVVGPELKIYQCGVPKEMAVELFRPFIMKKLVEDGTANNIKSAKKMVDKGTTEVWDALDVIIKDHPVMLNRAPTLHRLGIQAFEPILVEGKAIHLPPLACAAFNADFDGDQMAVHLPLSAEAQAEARSLMMASDNILKPADGHTVTMPSQDMILGLYYLSTVMEGAKGQGRVFSSLAEAEMALDLHEIDMQAEVLIRMPADFVLPEGWEPREIKVVDKDGHDDLETVKEERFHDGTTLFATSYGRVLFNETLPVDYPFVNVPVGKKQLSKIVDDIATRYSTAQVAASLDALKDMGFTRAPWSGVSFAFSDVIEPPEREEFIARYEDEAAQVNENFEMGLMTEEERRNELIKLWTECTAEVSKAVEKHFDAKNNLAIIVQSGARGNMMQINQIAGMRGLVANPKGEIIPRPVKSNYRKGLSVLEYFISSRGARKGLADTALRTADSGYLTRRMVDVCQDVIIRSDDCGADRGIIASEISENGQVIEKFSERIHGRYPVHDILKPGTDEVLISKDHMMDASDADLLEKFDIHEVEIRTVLTCRAHSGVCAKCYGMNLATSKPVGPGEAVGIIAAQSIGEPGTQLTMRTFHTGGVAGGDITQGLPRVEELFEARRPKKMATLSEIAGKVRFEEATKGSLLNIIVTADDGDTRTYSVPHTGLRVKDGDVIEKGCQIQEGALNPHDVLRIRGASAVHNYLIQEVLKVYRQQGVDINDKHIEVIVRQMMRKVRVEESGDTNLLSGAMVDVLELMDANEDVARRNAAGEVNAETGEPLREAEATQLLMGITKASLATDSFLSAASFQETTKVLTEAAIKGKVDHLLGLKENVIIGKLIPAGAGLNAYREFAEEIVPDREKPVEEETAAEPYDGEAAETASEAASTEAGESSEEV